MKTYGSIAVAVWITACGTSQTETLGRSPIDWTLGNPTPQLVQEASECPGGWSELVDRLGEEGQGHVPALSPST